MTKRIAGRRPVKFKQRLPKKGKHADTKYLNEELIATKDTKEAQIYNSGNIERKDIILAQTYPKTKKAIIMSTDILDTTPEIGDDFDFLGHYDEESITHDEKLLPDNTARSAINCGFVGIGGGGGKLARAFLDLGFNKTLLINTTTKDQPDGTPNEHFVLLEGADGVGKDVTLGKQVLSDNSAVVEDALRTRMGKVDWLFVIAGGGGGTGSATSALNSSFQRYLTSLEAEGKVVYIVTKPTAQELLNPTIKNNYTSLLNDINSNPHIVIDNERQLELLRGKVGILGMYPTANKSLAKLLYQVLKLASENSPVQTFDRKDLEKLFSTNGRIFLGTTIIRNPEDKNLGSTIFQNCLKGSPCPLPRGKPQTGVLLLVIDSAMASSPEVSKHIEAATSYVGGRTETLFSGVYIREGLPGMVVISAFGGL